MVRRSHAGERFDASATIGVFSPSWRRARTQRQSATALDARTTDEGSTPSRETYAGLALAITPAPDLDADLHVTRTLENCREGEAPFTAVGIAASVSAAVAGATGGIEAEASRRSASSFVASFASFSRLLATIGAPVAEQRTMARRERVE
jgi:hypothetical protein